MDHICNYNGQQFKATWDASWIQIALDLPEGTISSWSMYTGYPVDKR